MAMGTTATLSSKNDPASLMSDPPVDPSSMRADLSDLAKRLKHDDLRFDQRSDRHCERSEAIQLYLAAANWIASSLRSSQ
jgi:hypothetical protein